MQPGMNVACDERPGWPLQRVWPSSQRRQVTHNEMTAQRIMGRDVGGSHGAEVYGGGRLVPGETMALDDMS